MILALLGLGIGLLLGSFCPLVIPVTYSKLFSVALLAGLDAVFGAEHVVVLHLQIDLKRITERILPGPVSGDFVPLIRVFRLKLIHAGRHPRPQPRHRHHHRHHRQRQNRQGARQGEQIAEVTGQTAPASDFFFM